MAWHKDLLGLDAHDHLHYARHASPEVVAGQWRFSDTVVGLRFGGPTGPTLKADDGRLWLAGTYSVNPPTQPSATTVLNVAGLVTANSGASKGLGGQLVLNPLSHGSPLALGLYFGARKYGIYNAYQLAGLYAYAWTVPGSGGALASMPAAALQLILSGSPTIADAAGLDVLAPSVYSWAGTLAAYHGVRIADATVGTANRLLEAGPSTPYLRLLGGGNPPAMQTNLYLKEGATLRQVRLVDPGAGGANFVGGERVAILV